MGITLKLTAIAAILGFSLNTCHAQELKRKASPGVMIKEANDQAGTLINQELASVADSISKLMKTHHYSLQELEKESYSEVEDNIIALVRSVQSKEEFIQGFNTLWSNGPFSHVRLANAENPADQMADYIDSMRVGEQGVTLKIENELAVLTVNTMTGIDTKERVSEAYMEIQKSKAKNLIIDIRENGGGTFAGIPLVGHLLTDPLDGGVFVSRKWWDKNNKAPDYSNAQDLVPWEGWSIRAFWHDVQEEPLTRIQFQPLTPYFNGKVYVLISNKTASAAEFTVDAMAHLDHVTIIGETTAGEMLSQKMFDLPLGLQLSLPIAEYYSTRMGRIEGRGVQPDIEIDKSLSFELAMSLINGEAPNEALSRLEAKMIELEGQPLGGEAIYLLGSMNNWGNTKDATPQFEYIGNGVYETKTSFEKGQYEFKIASTNWSIDFGANENQEQVILGKKFSLSNEKGSRNLILEIKKDTLVTIRLYMNNDKNGLLEIVTGNSN